MFFIWHDSVLPKLRKWSRQHQSLPWFVSLLLMTGPTEGNSGLFKCPGARSPYLLLNGSSWKLKFGCSRCLPPRPCPWGGPAHTKVPLWLPPPGRQAAGQDEELQAGYLGSTGYCTLWLLTQHAPVSCLSSLSSSLIHFPLVFHPREFAPLSPHWPSQKHRRLPPLTNTQRAKWTV